MANMKYVTENKLTIEVEQQKKSSQNKVLIIGGSFVIATLFIHIYLAMFLFAWVLVIWFSQSGSEIIKAGAEGEDLAVKILQKLPDSYTVYNQVDIPK